MNALAHLAACSCCGLVQSVASVPRGSRARCARCRTPLHVRSHRRSHQTTAALALAALLLYVPAITLPIMRVERLGQSNSASIWSGTVELLADGQHLPGIVVLLCSIILPLTKLGALFVLSSRGALLGHHVRARTWRMVEWAGRWGMLDVLLVAVLVAVVKLGDIVQLSAGPAATAFTVFVLLNLAASASFDPHALWEETA